MNTPLGITDRLGVVRFVAVACVPRAGDAVGRQADVTQDFKCQRDIVGHFVYGSLRYPFVFIHVMESAFFQAIGREVGQDFRGDVESGGNAVPDNLEEFGQVLLRYVVEILVD